MKIEKIKCSLLYSDEHYAEKDVDELAWMVGVLIEKINEIIETLNQVAVVRSFLSRAKPLGDPKDS